MPAFHDTFTFATIITQIKRDKFKGISILNIKV